MKLRFCGMVLDTELLTAFPDFEERTVAQWSERYGEEVVISTFRGGERVLGILYDEDKQERDFKVSRYVGLWTSDLGARMILEKWNEVPEKGQVWF